jgi:pyruvate kinase
MSRHNSSVPIYAITPRVSTQRKLALYRNVTALLAEEHSERDQALREAEQILISKGVLSQGDRVVITSGEPMGSPGGTNTLMIFRVGDPR